MSTSEARRHDLYNGLYEILGTERAETLMAYLPTSEAAALATKADLDREIASVRTEIVSARTEIASVQGEVGALRAELREDMNAVNQRLDRLFLTLGAGLIAVVGTLITSSFL